MYNSKRIRIITNSKKVFLLFPLIIQTNLPNCGKIDDFQYLWNFIPEIDSSLILVPSSSDFAKNFNSAILKSTTISPEEFHAKMEARIQEQIKKQENLFEAPNCISTTIKKVSAVGLAIGMPENMIWGILGNIAVESGFDPTKIETIISDQEKFKIGPMKAYAISDMSEFTITALRQAYADSNWKIPHVEASDKYIMEAYNPKNAQNELNVEEYMDGNGGFCPGIGLFGFTGPVGTALQEYAISKDLDWHDIDCQLAFVIDPEGFSKVKGYNWIKDWIKNSKEDISIEQATDDWNVNFEGAHNHFKTPLKTKKAKELSENSKVKLLPNFYYSKRIFELAGVESSDF